MGRSLYRGSTHLPSVTATQLAYTGANPYAYYHPEKAQAHGTEVVSPCIAPGTLAAHGVRVSLNAYYARLLILKAYSIENNYKTAKRFCQFGTFTKENLFNTDSIFRPTYARPS
jgi:hypothetical protein